MRLELSIQAHLANAKHEVSAVVVIRLTESSPKDADEVRVIHTGALGEAESQKNNRI